jgi:hypothetical protein
VYWNINGTVDGMPNGQSWDTCDEVGAVDVVVTVDNGTPQLVDCDANGSMSVAISVASGDHQVAVKLQDQNGVDLTSEVQGTIRAETTKVGEFYADFYWNMFKTSFYGDFKFSTSYEDQTCETMNPPVVAQITLLKLNDSVLNPAPDVCGPDNSCYPCDGAAFGKCYDSDQVQSINNLTWGNYKLKLQGTLGSTDDYEICWESEDLETSASEVDILVGAGTENPIVPLDLKQIKTTDACAPL